MRTHLIAAVIMGLSGIVSAAAAPRYTFEFTVQVDGASPVALNLSAPPGTHHTLQATEHLRVEIDVPVSITDTSTTIVKLVDDSSGRPVVLHTARRSGPVGDIRTFGYAVCAGKTTFQSPLQATRLECAKQGT